MYLHFHGLNERPFNNTPDPRFLFLTTGHQEALAQLVYGVEERKGFIVLTGGVGTGKTTLVRSLLSRLSGNTAVALVFNSTLSFDELLEYILQDFGLPKGGETRVQRLVSLNNFLIERRRAGQNTAIIFDEAQNFDSATLEQIRLLSNFETATDKLIQILLVGQPELKAKLLRPELRQLKQRIGLRCAIPPLQPAEVSSYIRNRLKIAGAQELRLFEGPAILRISEYSEGIPRVINTICDISLLLAYADQTRRIDRRVVDRAIACLEEGELPSRQRWRDPWRLRALARWAGAGVAVCAMAIGAVLALQSDSVTEAVSVISDSLTSLAHTWWGR
jgi:general secretion pathway protein A